MPATADLLEQLAVSAGGDDRTPSKRALVIANPHATTVSDRLRNLVVYALRGRYDVEARDTQEHGHATEICREAAHEGFELVVAFGGDGTVSEAVDGLAGSATPLTCLPGGATNVYCRMLGVPTEIVDATEHLLGLADRWSPRRVDVGRVDGRHFAFSAGLGLDADVVRRVDSHPRLKARAGEYYFTAAAIGTFSRRYLRHPPQIELILPDGGTLAGVTAVVQNGDPYTWFGSRPVRIAEGASLTSGTLAGAVLRRANPIDAPGILARALAHRRRVLDHRQLAGFSQVTRVTARSVDGRPVGLQVDGDWQRQVTEAHFDVLPRALLVVG